MSEVLDLKLSENDFNKKIKVMIEKINTMENSMKNERIVRVRLEQENSELKDSILNIQTVLEEKEDLFKTIYIEKLNLEKELITKSNNETPEGLLMRKLNGKSKLNEAQSRMEYYKNLFEKERKKNDNLIKEIAILKKEYDDFRELEKEKNNLLINDSTQKENSNFNLKIDIKSLSEANKNYLIEINTLNNIIEQLYKKLEIMSIELNFYKNELHIVKRNLIETSSQLRRQEVDYTSISRKLNEFRSTLADIQVTNKIFNVTRIGRLYESNADIVFTQDEAKNYIVNIKYMYTSNIVKIMEIDDMELRNENVVKFKYSPILNLRNEKFKSPEANDIIKLYREMKERAIGSSNEIKTGEEQKFHLAQTNLKQMLEDIF